MNLFDAGAIAVAARGTILADGPKGPIETDSRAVTRGSWFVALVGEKFDGHAFVADVAAKGAAGVVVSRNVIVPPKCGAVRVDDTTAAYQALGRAARRKFPGPVVGVGGAAGKTTTRALTALALSPLGPIHQNEANLNNHIGVPKTLLALPKTAAAAVIEMGTSGKGEMAVLVDCAEPDVRICVNVGAEHLEGLGDLQGVADEEGELFARARPGDVLVINIDDPFVTKMARPAGTRAITYGEAAEADVRLVSAELGADLHTRAVVRTTRGDLHVDLPVPGRHIAHDAAGAIACAIACGVDPHAAAAALSAYEPVGMRMRREAFGGVVFLNDAYNANPPSVQAALDVLASIPHPGRRIAILGDMLELGSLEGALHDEVAAYAGVKNLDLVVLCGPRMSRAVGAGPAWTEPDVERVAERVRGFLKAGDLVLLKGSRGARVERVLAALRGETPPKAH